MQRGSAAKVDRRQYGLKPGREQEYWHNGPIYTRIEPNHTDPRRRKSFLACLRPIVRRWRKLAHWNLIGNESLDATSCMAFSACDVIHEIVRAGPMLVPSHMQAALRRRREGWSPPPTDQSGEWTDKLMAIICGKPPGHSHRNAAQESRPWNAPDQQQDDVSGGRIRYDRPSELLLQQACTTACPPARRRPPGVAGPVRNRVVSHVFLSCYG
jgi:hypothetical protein